MRPHADVDEFQIVFRRREGLDDILIRIDPSPALSLGERDGLRAKLAERSPDSGSASASPSRSASPGRSRAGTTRPGACKDERTEVPF